MAGDVNITLNVDKASSKRQMVRKQGVAAITAPSEPTSSNQSSLGAPALMWREGGMFTKARVDSSLGFIRRTVQVNAGGVDEFHRFA
jgi:hypothetical protein